MTGVPPVPVPAQPKYERARRRLAAAFVCLIFLICLGVSGYFISENSVNIPFADDWAMLPGSTGQVPVNLDWIWARHNEHRVPLSKLVLLGAYKVSGHDFRSGCWTSLAMLSVLALALLLLARHLRGYTSWTDAVFPLTTLSVAHCENLAWNFQVQFTGSALVPGLLLTLMAWRQDGPKNLGEILLAGLGGVSLCGFGTSSVIYAPFVAVWLGYAAWDRTRRIDPVARRQALALGAMACLIVIATGVYFSGMQNVEHRPQTSTWPVVRTTLQFLSMGVSPLLRDWYWPTHAWVVPGMLALTGLRLLLVFRTQPAERLRCAGLVLMLGGLCALALGIGWGRSDQGPNAGFTMRYVTLAMPSILLSYLVAVLYGLWPRGLFWQRGLCFLALVLYWPHYHQGYVWVQPRKVSLLAFERDLKSGIRSAVLAERHTDAGISHGGPRVYPVTAFVADLVVHLRKQHVGPFQPVASDGETRIEQFDADRIIPHAIQWDSTSRVGRTLQSDASLTLRLSRPDHVQRFYLMMYSMNCPRDEYPFKVIGLRPNAEPITLWKGDMFVREMAANLAIKIEDEISEIKLVWGMAGVEFRLPIVMVLAGKAPQSTVSQ